VSRWRLLVAAGSAIAAAGALHAAWNLRSLRRPPPAAGPVAGRVAVLIPARDEAHRIGPVLAAVLAQEQVPELSVTVLDDASSDRTADVVAQFLADPRLQLLRGTGGPPDGWLGKTWACQRLAETPQARAADTLVFLDADVQLAPGAVAAAVAALAGAGLEFASPWPRQDATGALARLVQPLQQWSWATTLPLARLERTARPSMAAANGQFLVIRRSAYDAVGGHAPVRAEVLEDIALARTFRRSGRPTGTWDGSRLARCRMYDDAAQLRQGYRKSLWAAFGPPDAPPPVRTAAVATTLGLLALTYLVPPAAVVLGPDPATRALGAAGTAAAAINRGLVARATGSPAWPDSLGHPLSVLLLLGLVIDSIIARRRGTASWKGRPVAAVG
jgi:hypothetical protein